MPKKKHNWKARSVVKTDIDNTETKKIKLDLKVDGHYDTSNELVLPSSKRKTKVKNDKSVPTKMLSNKVRKRLEKIVDKKTKNQNKTVSKESSSRKYFRDFEKYLEIRRKWIEIKWSGMKEINMDLFKMPESYSLAHCVAADLKMGRGIAVEFRKRFGRVEELKNQNQLKGGMAYLKDNKRFIYYLVTKSYSHGKPIMRRLLKSLYIMRRHMLKNNVKKLAIPRIGCGLDKLNWIEVKILIEFMFKETDIEIVVCNFDK